MICGVTSDFVPCCTVIASICNNNGVGLPMSRAWQVYLGSTAIALYIVLQPFGCMCGASVRISALQANRTIR